MSDKYSISQDEKNRKLQEFTMLNPNDNVKATHDYQKWLDNEETKFWNQRLRAKRKRNEIMLIVGTTVVVLGVIAGVVSHYSGSNKATNQSVNSKSEVEKSSSSITSSSSSTTEDAKNNPASIEGAYYSTADNKEATIKAIGDNEWKIIYSTADGIVNGTFNTRWESVQNGFKSHSTFHKSDGVSGFMIDVTQEDSAQSKSKISLQISDGNAAHTMEFKNWKSKIANKDAEAILSGDLSPFAGQYSTDEFEKDIKKSNFTLGGYTKEDYYRNATTNFDAVSDDGFWVGSMHANYTVDKKNLPTQENGYYKVNLRGINEIAIVGHKATIYLIPAGVKAFDGSVSDEKRIGRGIHGEFTERPYRDKWWLK